MKQKTKFYKKRNMVCRGRTLWFLGQQGKPRLYNYYIKYMLTSSVNSLNNTE